MNKRLRGIILLPEGICTRHRESREIPGNGRVDEQANRPFHNFHQDLYTNDVMFTGVPPPIPLLDRGRRTKGRQVVMARTLGLSVKLMVGSRSAEGMMIQEIKAEWIAVINPGRGNEVVKEVDRDLR